MKIIYDNNNKIAAILKSSNCDAWIVYAFSQLNPVIYDIVGKKIICTRPTFIVVPLNGEPFIICSAMEKETFGRMCGNIIPYRTRNDLLKILADKISAYSNIMMEYSSDMEMPSISFIDAGVYNYLVSLGVRIKSSADILQSLFSIWGADGYSSHKRAAEDLHKFILEAFCYIRDNIGSGITEYDVSRHLVSNFKRNGYYYEYEPLVACAKNSSDVHYFTNPDVAASISSDMVVMIDAHIRENSDSGIFTDITIMGYTNKNIPRTIAEQFSIITAARDLGCEYIVRKFAEGETVQGYEVDNVIREHIIKNGYGDYFIHRSGHSLDSRGHGKGVNLDNYETKDIRYLIDDIGFSIEPGIYLGEYGLRSEINCHVKNNKHEITTVPKQRFIVSIMESNYDKCFE